MSDFLIVFVPATTIFMVAGFFVPQLITMLGISGTFGNILASIVSGALVALLSILLGNWF